MSATLAITLAVAFAIAPPSNGRAHASESSALVTIESPEARAQAPAAPDAADALLAGARKLFDSLDYERALIELDKVVALLEPRRNEAAAREQLATALELRARTQFGLGATGRAREDFLALIALAPDYELDETVSPRVSALFTQVRALLVGQIALTVEPVDAQVMVDGRPVDVVTEPIDVVSGEHTLNVTRSGYKPATVNVSVEPGRATEWRVTLERAAATLSLQTQPADVEVLVNGTSRGRTSDGAADPGAASAAARPSAPFVLNDLAPGAYTIELRKACHQTLLQRVTVEQLIDYRAGPFTLDPAVGGLQVGSSRAAQIFLDGKAIGDAPRTIDPVCEGTHIVEARSRAGRDIQRIEIRSGEKASITLTPRPVIALLTTAGAADATAATKTGLIAASSDLRAAAERALAKSGNVLIYAPPAADVRKFETQERAPSGWLAFDLARKPLTPGARQAAEARRDLSARLAKAMDVQGVAALVTPPNGAEGAFWLVMLSAGASEPDTIELSLTSPAAAVSALEASSVTSTLLRRTLGLTFVDVLHRRGPVIVDVASGGGAAGATGAAGIVPGDALTHVNGEAVANEQDVRRLLEGLGPATTATLTLQSRAGATRDVTVPVSREPRLVTLAADSGLANISLLDLRTRLSETTGLDATAIRLNIAGALMRVGQHAAALEELQAIKLPDGPGFSNASVQYLIGLCHDALGRAAEARQAWDAASRAPRAILSEDGPLVSELAARRLQP